ncbi:PQQ-binding-like beta-propeller repeat protein [Halarchaeum sp. P4]|uniref:outer membrane protein assembly factor BamB family protein n=1 Tax=Halarchaeum sp. P4 TaxID=3421639 RepID=UPI003EB8269D
MSPPLHRTRRRVLSASAAAGVAGLAGCTSLLDRSSATVAGEWPSFGHNAQNTGYVRDETAPPDTLVRLWTSETAFRNVGPAAIATETVFHVIGHRLYALDRLDGTIRWKTTVGTWGSEAPILVDNTLYVGWSGGVRALNAATGERVWTVDIDGGVWGAPAYADGTVIVGSNAGRGAGSIIGMRDGSEDWRYEVEVGTLSGATAVNGTAYVGTMADVGRSAEADDDTQSVFAVSTADGSEEWTFTGVSGDVSVPAVTDGRVYVSCADDHLYAIDAANGEQVWASELPVAATSAPAVVNGVVYVGSTDGHVYALDAASGKPTYRVDVGGPIRDGLAVVDKVDEDAQYEGWRQRLVYAGTTDGRVAVVKTGTQDVVSTVRLGAPISGPPFVRDRLVHVATNDGNVHVLGN